MRNIFPDMLITYNPYMHCYNPPSGIRHIAINKHNQKQLTSSTQKHFFQCIVTCQVNKIHATLLF